MNLTQFSRSPMGLTHKAFQHLVFITNDWIQTWYIVHYISEDVLTADYILLTLTQFSRLPQDLCY